MELQTTGKHSQPMQRSLKHASPHKQRTAQLVTGRAQARARDRQSAASMELQNLSLER